MHPVHLRSMFAGPSVQKFLQAFKQQPLLCSAVLEAALRVKANAPSAWLRPSDPKMWLSAARWSVVLCEMTLGSKAETSTAGSSSSSRSRRNSSSNVDAYASAADHVQQLLLQQFALMLSALKHGVGLSDQVPAFRLQILDLAVHSALVGKKGAAAAAAAAGAGVDVAQGASIEAACSQLQQAWFSHCSQPAAGFVSAGCRRRA
jgi:hypothetical protein